MNRLRFISFISLLLTIGIALQAQTESAIGSESIASADSVPAQEAIAPAASSTSPRTTPVDIDDEKPRTVLHYYDKHGNELKEPVMFLTVLDTVQKPKSKPIYPAYNGMNVGLNFGDLIFMAFGQKYASFDLWANVSIHNWLFPVLECGLGYADSTPSKQNFTYRTKPSFYAKVGLNYNFLYKSNPDYQVYLGLRAGFSNFGYDVTNATITNDYWQQSQNVQLTGLRSTSFYGEVLAGLQVKIVSHFSLGWSVRWHFNFHTTKQFDSAPWFIPGYGASSPFGFTVSAIWTIPAKTKPAPEGEIAQ